MIDKVVVKNLKIHQDTPDVSQPNVRPGFLMEILRADEPIFRKFGQSTVTVAYPGTIKAFHYHERQDDLWFVATGRAVVVLHDMRADSPTRGQTDIIPTGQDDHKLILIPAGVVHGYKVLGQKPVMLFYHTTEPYDASSPDEKRLPYNDSSIAFNWDDYN